MIEQVHQQFKIIGTRITRIFDRGLLLIYFFIRFNLRCSHLFYQRSIY